MWLSAPLLVLAQTPPPLTGGNGWMLPKDVSENGYLIDWLLNVTMVFVTILFVIMVLWMGAAILKHGRKHAAHYDVGNAVKQVIFALTLSTIIFVVVDGNLLVNSLLDTRAAFWNFEHAESHPNAVRIEVNARQWAWEMRYAGPDGAFNTADDVLTLNDMRIPVGAPVIVQLASTDVLHSFYLPHLRVKTDAVPGMVNRFWFQAKETGRFEIGCAQHCGVAHYKMRGVLSIVTPEEFARWLRDSSSNGGRAFNAEDQEAHWGWEWRKEI